MPEHKRIYDIFMKSYSVRKIVCMRVCVCVGVGVGVCVPLCLLSVLLFRTAWDLWLNLQLHRHSISLEIG